VSVPRRPPRLGKGQPTLACRFYRTESGGEPVREWLRSLPEAVRKEIGADIKAVQ
jgi:phage-related protein